MITVEEWTDSKELRQSARQFFQSRAGKSLLQMLYRARQIPTGARSGEEENGMRMGWDNCIRFLEGTALAEDRQMEEIKSTFGVEVPEKDEEEEN